MERLGELKEAVVRVLERKGVLAQIRAQLRHEVFKAIDDEDAEDSNSGDEGWSLRSVLRTEEGAMAMALVKEFLQWAGLRMTASILASESGDASEGFDREDLEGRCGVDAGPGPVLAAVAQRLLAGGAGPSGAGGAVQASAVARPASAATRPVSAVGAGTLASAGEAAEGMAVVKERSYGPEDTSKDDFQQPSAGASEEDVLELDEEGERGAGSEGGGRGGDGDDGDGAGLEAEVSKGASASGVVPAGVEAAGSASREGSGLEELASEVEDEVEYDFDDEEEAPEGEAQEEGRAGSEGSEGPPPLEAASHRSHSASASASASPSGSSKHDETPTAPAPISPSANPLLDGTLPPPVKALPSLGALAEARKPSTLAPLRGRGLPAIPAMRAGPGTGAESETGADGTPASSPGAGASGDVGAGLYGQRDGRVAERGDVGGGSGPEGSGEMSGEVSYTGLGRSLRGEGITGQVEGEEDAGVEVEEGGLVLEYSDVEGTLEDIPHMRFVEAARTP